MRAYTIQETRTRRGEETRNTGSNSPSQNPKHTISLQKFKDFINFIQKRTYKNPCPFSARGVLINTAQVVHNLSLIQIGFYRVLRFHKKGSVWFLSGRKTLPFRKFIHPVPSTWEVLSISKRKKKSPMFCGLYCTHTLKNKQKKAFMWNRNIDAETVPSQTHFLEALRLFPVGKHSGEGFSIEALRCCKGVEYKPMAGAEGFTGVSRVWFCS